MKQIDLCLILLLGECEPLSERILIAAENEHSGIISLAKLE